MVPRLFEGERLLQEIGRTRRFYSKRDENFKTLRRWYHKKHDKPVLNEFGDEMDRTIDEPDLAPMTPNNIGTHMIDMAVATSTQSSPAIEVLLPNEGRIMRKRGNIAEKINAGIWSANSEIAGRSLLRDYFFNTYLLGWGVAGVFWDDTQVPESAKSDIRKLIEEGKKSEGPEENEASDDARAVYKAKKKPDPVDDEWKMPIVITVPRPEEIYPIPGGKYERWKGVFREQTMTLADAEDTYGVRFPRPATLPVDESWKMDATVVNICDFWHWIGDEVWHCIFAYNVPGYKEEEGKWKKHDGHFFIKEPGAMPEYNKLPYVIRFCIPTTDDQNGENFGLSLLYKAIDSIRETEIITNRWIMAVEMYAEPTQVTAYNSQLAQNAVPPEAKRGPGQTVVVDKGLGQEFEIVGGKGSPPDLKELLQMWTAMSKDHGFSLDMEGKSGLDSIVMKSGMLAKLIIPITEIESGLEAIHYRMIHLYSNLVTTGKLKIRGSLTIDDSSKGFMVAATGSQLKDMKYCKIKVKPRMPFEELQNVQSAQALKAAKLSSDDTIMTKYLGIEDSEMEKKKIREEMASDPALWIPKLADIVVQKLMGTMTPQVPVQEPTQEKPPQASPSSREDILAQLMQNGGLPGGATGNMPGQPAPSTSMNQVLSSSLPGRPVQGGGTA